MHVHTTVALFMVVVRGICGRLCQCERRTSSSAALSEVMLSLQYMTTAACGQYPNTISVHATHSTVLFANFRSSDKLREIEYSIKLIRATDRIRSNTFSASEI